MDLSKILAITGKPGLYKHIAQSKTGIVVESVLDNKRSSAFASDQISTLNDISIFTTDEDIKLEDVLKKIFDKEDGKVTISDKSGTSELKKYFEEVLPEYDKDRVYISDIKKVIKWYNILAENNILEFDEDKSSEEVEKDTDDKSEVNSVSNEEKDNE